MTRRNILIVGSIEFFVSKRFFLAKQKKIQ